MTDAALPAAEFREVSEERLTENRVVYPLAPFLEGPALTRYVWYKQRWSNILQIDRDDGSGDLPAEFERTRYCEKLVAAHGSPIAQRAVQQGNVALLSWLTGLTQRDADFSAAQTFSKMVHHLRRDGYMAVFLGGTDAGKTATALLLAALHLRDNPDAHLIANLERIEWPEEEMNERTHFAGSTEEVEELAAKWEDVIVILDEISTAANAQTSNYEVNDVLYPLITAKSKRGMRIIAIGHREDGYDVAPPLREHADHIVRQVRESNDLGDDTYYAEFYDGIEDGELSGDPLTLKPVPEVRVSYNPDEEQEFTLNANS